MDRREKAIKIAREALKAVPIKPVGVVGIRVLEKDGNWKVRVITEEKVFTFKWDEEAQKVVPIERARGQTVLHVVDEITDPKQWDTLPDHLYIRKIKIGGIEVEGIQFGGLFKGENKEMGIKVVIDGKETRVEGNTYFIKEELKKEGFKWDGFAKEWVKEER